MGRLVDGVWSEQWYDTKKNRGRFVRSKTQFRSLLGSEEAPAEAGRYHLYVSAACPWCHRVLIARALFGLEAAIPVTNVSPLMRAGGWTFADEPDPVHGATHMHQIYSRADPTYTGRVTVPVLWDLTNETIANNESTDIIRGLDSVWRPLHTREATSWYPEAHRETIDAINAWTYPQLNNGVYRAGFATTQEAYDEAVTDVFDALDRLEGMLADRPFLVTDHPTEADWRVWVTLIRFDAVYHGHFKCNRRQLREYPRLWAFTKALYAIPGVAETTDLDQIRTHYYASHLTINPTGVVPIGPDLDLTGEIA